MNSVAHWFDLLPLDWWFISVAVDPEAMLSMWYHIP